MPSNDNQSGEAMDSSDSVHFEILSLHGRPVPAIAVVGKDIGVQFTFSNRTNIPVSELEITFNVDPLCEYDIRECSEDNFRREAEFTERVGCLFRIQRNCVRISYNSGEIGSQEVITGGMYVRVKKFENQFHMYQVPFLSVNFVPVRIRLKAKFRFHGNESVLYREIDVEEVTFAHRGNMVVRIGLGHRFGQN